MCSFLIENKVAIITGGAAGIGLDIAKELLKNDAKGITIADLNNKPGDEALQEIEVEFGKNKAIFVTTDVRDIGQFEEVFRKTIDAFKHVDILVNNAGIVDDTQWNNETDINVKGTVNGILLGLEKYLQTNRSGNEAIILNLSSVAGVGVKGNGSLPVYRSTKFAIHGMTLAWGTEVNYDRTKVKVVAVCLGAVAGRLAETHEEQMVKYETRDSLQTSEQCAIGTIQVMESAQTGTVWIIEGGGTPYQFILPDRYTLAEKKYITS